ncbi:MAG: hypothetical protein N3A63_07150 [Bacteroidetes bacterium]|nr:hypothetical protein [Bacteroidota bacterium]
MPEQHEVVELSQRRTIQEIEESLQRLWEKAHAVSEVVVRLKNENRELRVQNAALREQVQQRERELEVKIREIESLRAQIREVQYNESALISKEEKEELKSKLRELIAKINSHL